MLIALMRSCNTALTALLRGFGRVCGWLLLALMLTILLDVIERDIFSSGSTQLQELEWHINATLFMLALGYAYRRDAHVRIDVIAQHFSPRTRAWIELVGILTLMLPYCLALIWFGSDYWAASFAFNESSASATGLPYRWILKGLMLLGFVLTGLAGLAGVIERLLFLQTGRSQTPTSGGGGDAAG